MIYTFRKELEEDFREVLGFTYRSSPWQRELEEESIMEVKLDCTEEVFKKIYGRIICEKKKREDGRLYVTAAEAADPVMIEFLQKSRKSKEYTVLQELKASDYDVEEDELLEHTRISIPVTGDPAILQEEFHIRFYDSKIFTVDSETICVVEDCTEKVAESIQKRAACIEKTIMSETGAFYLTLDEAGCLDWNSSPLIKNYNVSFFCLEDDGTGPQECEWTIEEIKLEDDDDWKN